MVLDFLFPFALLGMIGVGGGGLALVVINMWEEPRQPRCLRRAHLPSGYTWRVAAVAAVIIAFSAVFFH